MERDLNALGRGLFADHRDAAFEGVLERERRDLQLHLPGLHLGQVEDVVDEREQVVRPEERMSSRYSSCFSFTSPTIPSRSTCEKPMIAFSGVRSSCDMLARKSDLCWLAVSTSL